MGLIFKLAVLMFCVRHITTYGRPGQTTAIYAGLFLCAGMAVSLANQFTATVGAGLAVTFVYDLITGFALFWLLDRFEGNMLAFFSIIVMGTLAMIAVDYYMLFELFTLLE